MIKRSLLLLAIAGMTTYAIAQPLIIYTNASSWPGPTDLLFNIPRPGSSQVKFDFILSAGNKMTLEFRNLSQVSRVPDLDSLLQKVWTDLQNFNDSLSDPLASRRIDYYTSAADTKIRIVNYPQRGDVYRLQNKEITQLKVEQDTLRVRLFTHNAAGKGTTAELYYYVMLVLNNINELPAIVSDGKPNSALELLRSDLEKPVNGRKKKHNYSRIYGLYDLSQRKRLMPALGSSMINYGQKSINIPPYVQSGIQYVRGSWAGSIGVGLDVVNHITESQQQHYCFTWEPYFFFSRSSSGKTVMDKNSFISFKYTYLMISSRTERKLEIYQSIGLGYLIKRRGDWFEPTTFKASISGLQTKNLLLEPEFFFHKFFKGFSPSLKLVIYLNRD